MAVRNYSTPGVYRQEIDASEVTAPAGTSTGAIVIRSTKGPVNRPVLVTNDKDLLDTFGKPVFTSGVDSSNPLIPENGYGIYAALEFLKESNALYVGRVVDTDDKYSTAYINVASYDYSNSGTGYIDMCGSACSVSAIPVASYTAGDQFDRADAISSYDTSAVSTGNMRIGCIEPGNVDAGGYSNVAISLETFNSGCDWLYKYDGFPSSATSTAFSATSGTQVTEQKIVRLDVYVKSTTDSWDTIRKNIHDALSASATSGSAQATGLRGLYPPTETFYGTIGDQLDGNGKQLNLVPAVNGFSKYVYVTTSGGTFKTLPATSQTLRDWNLIPLSGGFYDKTNTGMGTAAMGAWDLFSSRELLPGVNILINPDNNTGVKQKVARIAATRMDCIATGQAGLLTQDKVEDILAQEVYGYTNPSYMALYAGYDKIYDQYNDKFVYLPKTVFGAAIMARVDRVANTWDAPAGINRAVIPSFSQKVTFSNDKIGQLYDRNINTSKFIPGTGSVLWGQKTAQLKKSALDRINVRRLLVYLENTIEPTLQSFLFELNNDRTRSRITSIVSSFLNGVQGAGGLTGYTVVCDTSNNTPDVIDNNQLFCDIYVQPTRVIEFITLRTIITRTGVSVVEI